MANSKSKNLSHVQKRVRIAAERLRAAMLEPNSGLPVSYIERLFDETAEGNMERRKAIADCMNIGLSKAIEKSNRRIEARAKAE